MSAQITINPALQSNAAGTFRTTFDGLIQGFGQPDPPAWNWLSGGYLDPSETLPMWGGVGISEAVPTPPSSPPLTPDVAIGGPIVRATNITGGSTAKSMTGFSTYDQAHAMVNSPQSKVPLAYSGGQVMFYRFGTNMRIAVKCAPILINLDGTIITSQVSWDFSNQQLVPYAPAYAGATVSGATWASTSGGQINFTVNVDYQALLTAGDIITVSGVVNTGGSSTTAFNGAWSVVSVPDSTHVIVSAPASATLGTYASGGAVAAGGGAIPVRILRVQATNCKTVSYDPVTGFANWDNNGAAALILL